LDADSHEYPRNRLLSKVKPAPELHILWLVVVSAISKVISSACAKLPRPSTSSRHRTNPVTNVIVSLIIDLRHNNCLSSSVCLNKKKGRADKGAIKSNKQYSFPE
jgi:hypothetical protein